MNKPIILVSQSIANNFRELLRKQGYDEINPNLFVFAVKDGQAIWEYTGDNWQQFFEFTCGVKEWTDKGYNEIFRDKSNGSGA